MRHDSDGRLTELGARTRTIPPALRRALQHRDRACRFPGCDVHVTQGHHIRHWAAGGPTTLSNLALLCRRHHRAVHEAGYSVAREVDGELRFWAPNGRLVPAMPPPTAVPDAPATIVRTWSEERGVWIGASTACATGVGGRLDLAWAIDVLHPRAKRLATLAD